MFHNAFVAIHRRNNINSSFLIPYSTQLNPDQRPSRMIFQAFMADLLMAD